MRILLVEDDSNLRSQVVSDLKKQGYAVDEAKDGEEGLYCAKELPIDLAIIDLGLPHLSGMEIIRKVRASGKKFPILILTARNRWQDKVEGLEAGGDDYVVKPFESEELLARVRALVRRSQGWTKGVLTCKPISLDSASQSVIVHGQTVDLTAYEFKVLEYLMMHAGEVVSKQVLEEHIYDEERDRESNVMEVFIRRLRKKLDPKDTLNPIETLPGRGYRLTLKRT